jgi:hypothetical protein
VPESTPLDVALKDARRNLELAAFEWGDSLAI